MTSSNGNIFRVTGLLCGEFTGPVEFPTQRPVTRSFDVSLDLRLNKRLSKQPWGWWFETPSWSLWRHRNAGAIQKTVGVVIGVSLWKSYQLIIGLNSFFHAIHFSCEIGIIINRALSRPLFELNINTNWESSNSQTRSLEIDLNPR